MYDYQMLGDQISATKLLRPIVIDPKECHFVRAQEEEHQKAQEWDI